MYSLMIVQMLNGLKLPDGVDDWRRGQPVDLPAAPLELVIPPRDKPLPAAFRSLAPVFSDELIAFFRDHGADNLQTIATNVPGYSVVNIASSVSLASFFADLPAPDTFERGRDKVAREMQDVSGLVDRLATRAAQLPKPTAPIARLREGNKPIIVRTDLANELEANKTTGCTFDDPRFASMYIGSGFYNLASEALD